MEALSTVCERELKASKANVEMATKTLDFVLRHRGECAEARAMCAALVRYQETFSKPMPLPFGMGNAFEGKLPTPRDEEALLELGALVRLPEKGCEDAKKEHADRIVVLKDGKWCCTAGDPLWRCVEDALEEKEDVPYSCYDWIPGMMEFLVKVGGPEARRLCACWYYVSTECEFGGGEDEEKEEDGEMQVAKLLEVLTSHAKKEAMKKIEKDLEGCPSEDESDDEDYEYESSEEDDEEEEEVEEAAPAPEEETEEPPKKKVCAECPPDPVIEDIRKRILAAVEALHAYFPVPSNAYFFECMLRKMRDPAVKQWFPWGAPPLARIVEAAEKEHAEGRGDGELAQFLGELLLPFYEAQEE